MMPLCCCPAATCRYTALTTNKWDIVVIMLGTNDAKDPGDGGPNNWLHDCGE